MKVLEVTVILGNVSSVTVDTTDHIHEISEFFSMKDLDGIRREVWKCESCYQLFDGEEIYREAKVWLEGGYE